MIITHFFIFFFDTLPFIPSPILQETFKQTTYNKINTLDLTRVFYHIDVFLGIVSNISRLPTLSIFPLTLYPTLKCSFQ